MSVFRSPIFHQGTSKEVDSYRDWKPWQEDKVPLFGVKDENASSKKTLLWSKDSIHTQKIRQ